jgi:hypothetical protein
MPRPESILAVTFVIAVACQQSIALAWLRPALTFAPFKVGSAGFCELFDRTNCTRV